jgi:rubrerythrin
MDMSEPAPQPEPKQAATQTSARKYVCDRCGHEMYEHNCKITCPNCGNRFDCSDLNIYFD